MGNPVTNFFNNLEHKDEPDLADDLTNTFQPKATPGVPTGPQPTSVPLYTETQTITLNPGVQTPLINLGSGFLLDCTIYILNPSLLQDVGINNANTLQLSIGNWKGSGQSSKVYLDKSSFTFSCKNRDVNNIIAINNYTQTIQISLIYTVKTNSDNVEATVDNVQQIIGLVNAQQFGQWITTITTPSSIPVYALNSNIGEAPQLSSIYGQYDNGSSIFTFYDNFIGNSLNAQWTSITTGTSSVTVNNGLTIINNSGYIGLIYLNTAATPSVAEMWTEDSNNTGDISIAWSSQLPSSGGSNDYGLTYSYRYGNNNNSIYKLVLDNNGSGSNLSTISGIRSGPLDVFGITWNSTGSISGAVNYSNYNLTSNNSTITYGNSYLTLYTNDGGADLIYWARTRKYMPTMPTTLVVNTTIASSLYGTGTQLQIQVTNLNNSATPTNWTQLIQLPALTYNITALTNAFFTYDAAGQNVIPSWFESSFDTATWWINFGSNTIPSKGSTTIYMWLLGSLPEFNLAYVGGIPIALGQTLMEFSMPVTIASDQFPLIVENKEYTFNSTGGTYQQAITASATQLYTGISGSVTIIKNMDTSTQNVFLGPNSAVTTSTGFMLAPGEGIVVECVDAGIFYAIAANTGATVNIMCLV